MKDSGKSHGKSITRICIVQPSLNSVTETFLHAHGSRLSNVVGIVHRQGQSPALDNAPVLSQHAFLRACRKLGRMVRRCEWDDEVHLGYETAFRKLRAAVVLAEYGTTGAEVMQACRRAGVPLVVHFHGYDVSVRDVLAKYQETYARMFQQASAIVAVSRVMEIRLLSLGCPREKLVYLPYGVDGDQFRGASPATADPTFVAVGRLVDKKAPHLTLLAFARAHRDCPEIRLRMIGDGPLMSVCRDLARGLEIDDAVAFLGAQSHAVVQKELCQARAFVQHSVTALSGDCEGTPIAVLEAGAIGLPVIATRHAGIPDVVIEGKTGMLVDEQDVAGMAEHMVTLVRNPELAGKLGQKAASHIRKHFMMEQSIQRLDRVLQAAAQGGDLDRLRVEIESELAESTPPLRSASGTA